MWWLILEAQLNAMVNAMKGAQISASDIQAFESRSGDNRALTIAGDKAEIKIHGILTPQPSFMAAVFGGGNTTYSDIIDAAQKADADDEVSEVILHIDSPGGSVSGMFDAMAAIAAISKPTRAVVRQATSAAYGLASQAKNIEATSKASQFGSAGIVATARVEDDTVEITSSNAPNKRPDVTTEAGQAVVRAELDEIEDLFFDQIAAGRGTNRETIQAEFGRGGTMLAESALKRGMIDSIRADGLAGNGAETTTTADNGGEINEARPMDLIELKAKHPELFAQVVQQGATEERDRVSAHLTLGQTAGAMDIAIEAIETGAGLTATYQAKYMAAGMNMQNANDRTDDDAGAAGAVDAVDDSTADEVDADAKAKAEADILQLAAAQAGVTVEA